MYKLIFFAVSFLCLVLESVYAADCYGDSKPASLFVANYQSAVNTFCGADINSNSRTYQFGFDGSKRKTITCTFSGNAKAKYCQTGFGNIISQCVQATCGRNACPLSGGKWDWSSGGEEAHFTIRGVVA